MNSIKNTSTACYSLALSHLWVTAFALSPSTVRLYICSIYNIQQLLYW